MSTNNPDSIPDATPSTFVADASVQVSPPTQAEDPFVDPQPEADPFADPEAPPASSKEHKSPAPSIHAASFSGGEYHAAFTVDDLGNVKR